MRSTISVSPQQILAYQRDGVVLIKGLFALWTEQICAGIEKNMAEPGPYAAENLENGAAGRFFDDYCNWTRIAQFEEVIRHSAAAEVAARLMGSSTAQFFHEHVLVKEPGTSKATPWHQDAPYYFVEGEHTLSFWSPMDHVEEATLRCVAGSHKWEKPVLPTKWLSEEEFYPEADQFIAVPDPDSDPDQFAVLEWEMQPGDAVAFHYKVLHGARGNLSGDRRRAFSLRFVGDDAHFVTRPGPTSPPFPGHGMVEGQRLREDWFPTIYRV